MGFRIALFAVFFFGCSNAKSRFVDQYYSCEMGFFVTNPLFTGGVGVANADAQCAALSSKVGDCQKRPWRAYLSTRAQNARDRIGKGPWYNSAGQLFAADLESLYATPPDLSLFLTEEKQSIGSGQIVFTGSTASGQVNFAENCDDFTNGSSGNGATGIPGSSAWSGATSDPCFLTIRLYCFAAD